jgi:hypothetical protein
MEKVSFSVIQMRVEVAVVGIVSLYSINHQLFNLLAIVSVAFLFSIISKEKAMCYSSFIF